MHIDSVSYQVNGLQDKFHKYSDSFAVGFLQPLLGFFINVVVAPEFSHEFLLVHLEFSFIPDSKIFQGESPSVQSGSKSNCSLLGVNLLSGKYNV